MDTKIIEIRDRSTKIITVCTRMNPNESYSTLENKQLRAAGFDPNNPMIYLLRLDSNRGSYDPFIWDSRFSYAHRYIERNFDRIPNGWVVDIEYILKETNKMKIPEVLYHYTDDRVNIYIKDGLHGDRADQITIDELGELGDEIYDRVNSKTIIPIFDTNN